MVLFCVCAIWPPRLLAPEVKGPCSSRRAAQNTWLGFFYLVNLLMLVALSNCSCHVSIFNAMGQDFHSLDFHVRRVVSAHQVTKQDHQWVSTPSLSSILSKTEVLKYVPSWTHPDTYVLSAPHDPTRLEEHGRRTFEAVLERSVRRGVMGHTRRERAG